MLGTQQLSQSLLICLLVHGHDEKRRVAEEQIREGHHHVNVFPARLAKCIESFSQVLLDLRDVLSICLAGLLERSSQLVEVDLRKVDMADGNGLAVQKRLNYFHTS